MSTDIDKKNSERYDKFLNEVYPDILIGPLLYKTSYVFKNLSPIEYATGLVEFLQLEKESM